MSNPVAPKRIIIAITGATGAIYGVRLLQHLRDIPHLQSHLLISDAGVLNIHQELDLKRKDIEAMADVVHSVRDVGATIASGSFQSDGMIIAPCSMKTLAAVAHGFADNLITRAADVGATIASGSFQSDGMIIAPCSMKTLAAVAHGFADNLITRAADVVLKERRRLVLMVRETPFNLAHLRNMTAVTEMGGIVFPPLPNFYHRPASIEDMVDHSLARVLDLFQIEHQLAPRWAGLKESD